MKYQHLFTKDYYNLSAKKLGIQAQHYIPTNNHPPIQLKPYWHTYSKQDFI